MHAHHRSGGAADARLHPGVRRRVASCPAPRARRTPGVPLAAVPHRRGGSLPLPASAPALCGSLAQKAQSGGSGAAVTLCPAGIFESTRAAGLSCCLDERDSDQKAELAPSRPTASRIGAPCAPPAPPARRRRTRWRPCGGQRLLPSGWATEKPGVRRCHRGRGARASQRGALCLGRPSKQASMRRPATERCEICANERAAIGRRRRAHRRASPHHPPLFPAPHRLVLPPVAPPQRCTPWVSSPTTRLPSTTTASRAT
jgi:hypothetical protein